MSPDPASTPTCTNTAAGRNGNRTSFTDTKDGTLVTDVGYCYDWADHVIYDIDSDRSGLLGDTDAVWKYGISRVGMVRADSQLSLCNVRSGSSECFARQIGTAVGWVAARAQEIGWITSCYYVYGNCPPGQFVSCK